MKSLKLTALEHLLPFKFNKCLLVQVLKTLMLCIHMRKRRLEGDHQRLKNLETVYPLIERTRKKRLTAV